MITLETLVWLAGVGQLGLVVGSLAIPRVLGWREQLAGLRPLIRQVFWTYAAYIWCTNLSFGLISALAPSALLDRSTLATAVTLFITAYWLGRVLIQFFYFDRHDAPQGRWIWVGETILVALFICLTLVYGAAFFNNLAEPTLGAFLPAN